jgi:hypothetical protein
LKISSVLKALVAYSFFLQTVARSSVYSFTEQLYLLSKMDNGMRNAMVQLCLVIMGISSIHAVRLMQTASFHVRVFPATAADRVWAIQGHDSLEMTNVQGEYYLRSINPGYWQVSIEANAPYRDSRYEMTVKPGIDKDLGEIRLQPD